MAKRVSAVQAVTRALATYLATVFPDAVISDSWPDNGRQLPAKAITILAVGSPQIEESSVSARKVSDTNATQSVFTWTTGSIAQDLQLDVWATDSCTRDDLVARMDDALNAGAAPLGTSTNFDPVDQGLSLRLLSADGFDGVAHFLFEGDEDGDTADAIKRSEYRTTYRGTAYVTQSQKHTSPRVKRVIFKQKISEASPPDPAQPKEITTVTATSVTHTRG